MIAGELLLLLLLLLLLILLLTNCFFLVPARARTDAFQAYSSVFKPDVTTEGEWNLTERHGAHAAGPKK